MSFPTNYDGWLYFGIGLFSTLATIDQYPWYVRGCCLAVSNGLLGVKALRSTFKPDEAAGQTSTATLSVTKTETSEPPKSTP